MPLRFQFTHPGKGATLATRQSSMMFQVSIHAPWEGCDREQAIISRYPDVSIHAPWEGCDCYTAWALSRRVKFQFTHPGKGATGHSTRGDR